MLKINVNDSQNVTKIEATGTFGDIMAELSFVIHDIHNSMHQHDPAMARVFRQEMIVVLTDPESPIWKTEKPSGRSFVMSMPKADAKGGN